MKILWSECILRQKNTSISIYDKIFQANTSEALIVVRMDDALSGLDTGDAQSCLRLSVLITTTWVCRLLVATCLQRSSSLKGRVEGGRAQRMLPPVAAPHCGICSRPFRLLTWRHKPVPGAGSLCFISRFRGAKRSSSESGSRGWETDPAWFVCRTQLERQVAAFGCGAFGGFFREKCGPESSRCVFRWICARLRNENSGEDPAALPAALLLWSRAARCHVDRADPPGTRWDAYLQTTLIWFSHYSMLLVCI